MKYYTYRHTRGKQPRVIRVTHRVQLGVSALEAARALRTLAIAAQSATNAMSHFGIAGARARVARREQLLPEGAASTMTK